MSSVANCRECGALVPPSATECPECGIPLASPGPAGPAAEAQPKAPPPPPKPRVPRKPLSRGVRSAILGTFIGLTVLALILLYFSRQQPAGAGGDTRAGNGRVTSDSLGMGGGTAADSTHLDLLKRAVEKVPGNPTHWIGLGNAYYDAGRFADAIGSYRKALALDPSQLGARVDLGTSLFQTGSAELALAELDTVLARDPVNENGLYNRGVIALKLGRKEESQKAWRLYVEKYPNAPHAKEVKAHL
jgi:tetratricopeptide (TPR) repeat protein